VGSVVLDLALTLALAIERVFKGGELIGLLPSIFFANFVRRLLIKAK
jgi:hypothetical protein